MDEEPGPSTSSTKKAADNTIDEKPGTSAACTSANTCTLSEEDYISYNCPDIKTLARDKLSMQVDCVSWNQQHNLLAVGGYELNKNDTSVRLGRIYLITLDSNAPNGYSTMQEEQMPGVLDLKWEPTEHNSLVVATANRIIIFELCLNDAGLFRIEEQYIHFLPNKSSVMPLYIEWMRPTQLIFGDSIGSVNVLGIARAAKSSEDGEGQYSGKIRIKKEAVSDEENENPLQLFLVDNIKLHDSIIWIVHYDKDSDIVYTGADDGTFIAFHLFNFLETEKKRWFTKRFPVGVTSISTIDDIVAIGCYDDLLRIYTFNITNEPERKVSLIYQTEVILEGAVWRTLWLPNLNARQEETNGADKEYKIAVAAARNGIHLFTLKRSSWSWSRHVSCMDYKGSLAYGLDVKTNVVEKSYTVATCYFDNHALHVWKTNAF